MKYLPAVMLTVFAAGAGCIGGVLQGFAGAGSQPGLVITHLAAAIFICALTAAVIGWLAGSSQDRQQPSQRAYITATDGHTVIPMLGPYENESVAFDTLPHARAQFDAEGRYEWTVQSAAVDTTLTGLGNEHFKPPSVARQ
ncbi:MULTISPECIES: hypothetical protein [Mycobacteriaceae]|uniref:hypothetical protein n=1 Tax=Mycobacteriaceae TaxID=1762 RepID=UPI0007EB7E0C|nr:MULTISPECIES: hypothetical protein [Mycobacteriaceae]OBF76130.1 hypothetical protein A5751_24660 [Mycolicibacterium fortuitum]TMS51071.1 hypothetical protein E0T84_21175 [Mycobacterium sp. DBP42]